MGYNESGERHYGQRVFILAFRDGGGGRRDFLGSLPPFLRFFYLYIECLYVYLFSSATFYI